MSDQAVLQKNHFGKIPAWSLIYFLNYACFDIQPSPNNYETPSIKHSLTTHSVLSFEPGFDFFKQTSNCFFDDSEYLSDQICRHPTTKDPYEDKLVNVKTSLIADAGEGLFAKQNIQKGQLVAFFHAIPLENEKGSDYSISCHEFMMDIPEKCRDIKNYCATLAHKICHSFEPNADYSYAFHPRFGRHIRCAVAIKSKKRTIFQIFASSPIKREILFKKSKSCGFMTKLSEFTNSFVFQMTDQECSYLYRLI